MRVMCLAVCVGLLTVAGLRADDDEVARLKKELEAAKAENAKLVKTVGELEARVNQQADAQKKAAVELENLQKDHEAKKLGLEKLEPKLKDLQDRAEKLVADITLLRVAVTAIKEGRGPVRGSVSEFDAKNGLVTITVGSDAGLRTGVTLEVFRPDPKIVPLGKIKVIAVRAKEAVGQLTPFKPKIAPQIGDQVADTFP